MDLRKPLKFEYVYEDLKKRILLREFRANNKLPSEEKLATTYNCSRPTLRKAINKLTTENYVYSIQGSGSYLNQKIYEEEYNPQIENNADKDSLYGLICPNLGPEYIFQTITDHIANLISHMNYSIIWGGYISPTSSNLKNQIKKICNTYINLRVKGVFFSPFEYNDYSILANTEIISTLQAAHIPIILIDADITNYPLRSNIDLVSIDHIKAGYTLANHMLEKGVGRLLFVAPPFTKNSFKQRVIGYHEALLEHNIVPQKEWQLVLDPENKEVIYNLVNKYNPEGIICLIDRFAVSFIKTLQSLDISVPNDIIVGGFDNLSYLSAIPITSIQQPLEAISSTAVNMMYDRQQHPDAPVKTVSLSGELIIKSSTDKHQ